MCRLDREAWARYGIMVQGQDSPSNKMFLLGKNQNSKWRIGHWEEKKKSITLEITSKRATSKTSRKVDFCCHVLRITKKKKKRDSSNTHRLRTGQVPVNTGSKCESKIKWLQ